MKTLNDLCKIIEPIVTGLGYEFVGCEFAQQAGRSVVRIYLDGPLGISIDQCAIVSRQISAALDVEQVAMGAYFLEVSSPGLDRPLFVLAHYQRFIGKLARIKLRQPRENRRSFKGKIEAVEGDKITLDLEEGGKVVLMFNEIERANLVPEI